MATNVVAASKGGRVLPCIHERLARPRRLPEGPQPASRRRQGGRHRRVEADTRQRAIRHLPLGGHPSHLVRLHGRLRNNNHFGLKNQKKYWFALNLKGILAKP